MTSRRRRAGALFAVAAPALALALAGCGRVAPIDAEALARDEYVHQLTEREGLTDLWYLLPRVDVVFEDGFSGTQMIAPALSPHWTLLTGPSPTVRQLAVRWIGPSAHLRVRDRGANMHLRIWGRIDRQRLYTRPRLSVTFDGGELYSQVVGDDGGFEVDAVIPAKVLDGWSDVYIKLSSVHEPWREPASLRVARVEGVSWEPVR